MNADDYRDRIDYYSLSSNVLAHRYIYPISLQKDPNISAIYPIQIGTGKIKIVVQEKGKSDVTLEYITITGKGKTEKEALDNVLKKETRIFKMLLLKASEQVNRINIIREHNDLVEITKSELEIVQYEVEKWRLQVDKFLISSVGMNDIRDNFPDLDLVTAKDLEATGLLGSLWGVDLIDIGIEYLPLRTIFAVTEGKYLGTKVLKSVENTHTFEGPHSIQVVESLCIVNPRAVACSLEEKFIKKSVDCTAIQEESKKLKQHYKQILG